MAERAKVGKRVSSAKSRAPAADGGETPKRELAAAADGGDEQPAPRRKRGQTAPPAQWQRQLLLPSADERSAPFRAAAASARKASKRKARVSDQADATSAGQARPVAPDVVELELAVSAEDAGRVIDSPSPAADGGGEMPLVDAATLLAASDDVPSDAMSCTPQQRVARAHAAHAAHAALAALEERGARFYDAASCDCARALLVRAQQASPRAAELLTARAAVHVQRLGDRLDRARAVLEARIAEAEQRFGALPDERSACARGELVVARRSLRRRACLPPSLAIRPSPTSTGAARTRSDRLEEYRAASFEWVAVSALARAVDVVPEHAGPYNPLRIASDLLERIRAVSPTYLNAQLQRLEQLASMLALPELPEAAAKPASRKR